MFLQNNHLSSIGHSFIKSSVKKSLTSSGFRNNKINILRNHLQISDDSSLYTFDKPISCVLWYQDWVNSNQIYMNNFVHLKYLDYIVFQHSVLFLLYLICMIIIYYGTLQYITALKHFVCFFFKLSSAYNIINININKLVVGRYSLCYILGGSPLPKSLLFFFGMNRTYSYRYILSPHTIDMFYDWAIRYLTGRCFYRDPSGSMLEETMDFLTSKNKIY
ncbi:hypothetical protein AGLY_013591 [Aphis glycines]|uniref:Uncharacterized protein n=1 Tax=Aphis glycines TaxID=307491 RepID=A0A6G0T7L8_APHGL|nr:hypothetical protein AGLY_013591 [Aphis glycines]